MFERWVLRWEVGDLPRVMSEKSALADLEANPLIEVIMDNLQARFVMARKKLQEILTYGPSIPASRSFNSVYVFAKGSGGRHSEFGGKPFSPGEYTHRRRKRAMRPLAAG
tara:strand:+ start:9969 stop:10298 length:330 start_codon:yes stop_codon:yes gene_type:complete